MSFRVNFILLFIYLAWQAVSVPALCQPYRLQYILSDSAGTAAVRGHQQEFSDSASVIRHLRSELTAFWRKGYLAASIDSIHFDSLQAVVWLFAGETYRWADISTDSTVIKILRQSKIRPGKILRGPVDPRELASLQEKIIRSAENNGYPFAMVSLEDVSISGGGISARMALQPNSRYSVDSIIIRGNAMIRDRYFQKLTGIRPGDVYREDKLAAISRRISETGFLSEIKPFELEFYESTVDLYTYINKSKGNQFNGIIGFLPDHTKSGKLLLTGDVNLLLINSFRRGESIGMAWKKPEPLTQELHVNLAWPFVFNTDIGTGLTFDLYKQDTTFLTVNPVINLNFFMDGMNYIRLYYDYSSSILLNNSGQAEPDAPSVNAGMSSALYGLGFLFRKLDYLYNPRKGFFADISLGIGTRKLTDGQSGENTSSGEDDRPRQAKFSGRSHLQVFIPAGRSFTFLVQNRSGLLSSDGIFENELFRLGGINSFRGVEENSVLASAFSIFTAEARFLFEENSSFYLFFDSGYYRKETTAGRLTDTPMGFGAGLSLQSGLGIFTINYAIGQEFDNPINISRAKIHLGYISRF